jgi:hypothetical protein
VWRIVAGVLAALGVAGGILLLTGDGEDDAALPAPPAGAVSLGSALGGPARSMDCRGEPAGGSSPACTVVQTDLAGRPLVATRDGTVRAWVVRGVAGDVALRVISRFPGGYAVTASGPWQHVPTVGVHRFSARLPVRRGDRVGLELAPGASVGVGTAPGTTARFISQLTADPRPPETETPPALARELLLRVDVVYGEPATVPPAATPSGPGRRLDSAEFTPEGRPRTVAVVRVGGVIYLDLLAGRRRLARVPVTGADPRGRTFRLDPFSFTTVTVSWRNPDGRIVDRTYAVTAESLRAEH